MPRRRWMREKCVLCSLCTVLCPRESFSQVNGRIEWDAAKCEDCEECLPSVGCPRRAIN